MNARIVFLCLLSTVAAGGVGEDEEVSKPGNSSLVRDAPTPFTEMHSAH